MRKTNILFAIFTLISTSQVSASADAAAGATLLIIPFLFMMFFFMVIPVLVVLAVVFWVFMLIDCVKRDFPKEDEKIVWIIVIALTSWIGALIYYFTIKKKDKK